MKPRPLIPISEVSKMVDVNEPKYSFSISIWLKMCPVEGCRYHFDKSGFSWNEELNKYVVTGEVMCHLLTTHGIGPESIQSWIESNQKSYKKND